LRLEFLGNCIILLPQMDISNLKEGTVIIKDKLSIIKKLGEGYSGVVYLADDEVQNRNVAIKFLKKTEQDYDLRTKRFKEEYKKQLVGKTLTNIAEIYQFGQFEGFLYFTSEFVSETNIFRACRGIPINKALELFVQMFEGLDFLHRSGILHLDIKAENVLVKTENGKPIVKLVDFGVAAKTSEEIRLAGTPLYVAPEVALGLKEKIGVRSDMFSAAVLMYYCLTTIFPFCDRSTAGDLKDVSTKLATEPPPEPLTKFKRDAPEYLNTLILRLLSTNPDERFYPNARAVINSLLTNSSETFGTGVLQSYLRPIGNRHIGRDEIQTTLKSALNALITPSPLPSPARGEGGTFCITGYFGLGKTHLLEMLKEEAVVLPESVYVSAISFPADELAIETWAGELQRELSDNSRSILILADDVHNCNPEDKAGSIIQNIINTISERKKRPDLYADIRPVMLVMADEPFEQSFVAQDISPAMEHYDWRERAQNGGAVAWEMKQFSKPELLEYLKSTPALKDKEISEKWLEHLMWATSGFPADVALHLEEKDRGKMLFDLDGSLILPYTIVPNMDEPSIEVTSLKWMPLPAKERLLKQYNKLEPLERKVVNLISIWNHRKVARAIAEDDITGFFYLQAIKQAICNLAEKNVIVRGKAPKQSPERDCIQGIATPPAAARNDIAFTHPYMQSVVYDDIPQIDREVIHDMIAGYLKNDEGGILLHKGYGGDKRAAIVSLVRLARRKLYNEGALSLASLLLKDAYEIAGGESPSLKVLICALLIEAHQLSGRNLEADRYFDEACKVLLPALLVQKNFLYIKEIKNLLNQGKIELARELINEGMGWHDKRSHWNIILNNYLARSHYDESFKKGADARSLLEKAETIYRESERLEENLPPCLAVNVLNNDLGDVLFAEEKYEEAIKKLNGNLQRYNTKNHVLNQLAVMLTLGDCYIRCKDFKNAVKIADEIHELAKRTKSGRWAMKSARIKAIAYYYAGDFENSIKHDDRCLAAAAGLEDTQEKKNLLLNLYVRMGHNHKENKGYEKAKMYFEHALACKPDGLLLGSVHEGLGEALHFNSEHQEALKHLEIANDIFKRFQGVKVAAEYMQKISELKKDITNAGNAS